MIMKAFKCLLSVSFLFCLLVSCNCWSINRRNALFAFGNGALVSIQSFGAIAWADDNVVSRENDQQADDEEERRRKEEIRQRILERRQLMEAGRSSNSRQSYLNLSRQRAAIYNTTSRAVSCPPNIPCL